jgi:hypothetical protein
MKSVIYGKPAAESEEIPILAKGKADTGRIFALATHSKFSNYRHARESRATSVLDRTFSPTLLIST